MAKIFLAAAPLGLVAFLAILALEEVPLGTKSGAEAAAGEQREGEEAALAAAAA